MLIPFLLLGLAIGAPVSFAAPPSDPLGAARGVRVIDGDTLQIDGNIVQLYGIDAPELGQFCQRGGDLWPCGLDAALFLQKTVSFQGPPMQCAPWDDGSAAQTDDDVVIGVCQIGPKVIGLTMVNNGYAVALPDSFPDYKEAEEQARQAKLGLWQSEFVLPWEWRGGKRAEVKSSDWVRTCNVKGTLGPAGERIYYVPTDPDYDDIAVDPARGERLFCSDEEARAAGWTRSSPTPDQ